MSATADDFGAEQFREAPTSSDAQYAEVLTAAFDRLRETLLPLVNAAAFIRAAQKATKVEGRSDEAVNDGITTETHTVTVNFATEAEAMAFARVLSVLTPKPTFEQLCEQLNLSDIPGSEEIANARHG